MSPALDPPLCFPRGNQSNSLLNPFSASPVIRLSSKPSNTTHTILTIPAQGWSIYNAQDHSILSSQKLPPAVTFKSPCFSFSIPKQITNPDNTVSKSRSRFIYAPIASCPSDPSEAVNQGRTIWIWIENEVNRGFGERTPTADPSNSASANLIKTFSDPIQYVTPIQPSSTSQVARILVLLQSGTLHLTDEHLNTLKTCSIYSAKHAPSISPSLQETRHSIQLVHPSNLSTTPTPHDQQLIYLTRCKPHVQSNNSAKSSSGVNNSRSSNKRKSSQHLLSAPTPPRVSHYSHVEIYIIKLSGSDQLDPLAQLSDSRDFLDLTISPQGWITILELSHVLSTFCLPDPSTEQSSFPHLTLLPHPQCAPIKLAICPRSNSSSTASLTPSLVTLPSSLPLVFLFTSHPNQLNTCLGLVVDLYHQAVLHVLQFPWPTPPKTVQSQSNDQEPQTISTYLSPFSSSDHLFMCLSYKSLFVLQVLHPPQSSLQQPPTWVDILDPQVKQATLDWVTSKADSQVQIKTSQTELLEGSISSCNFFTFSSSSSKNKDKKETSEPSQEEDESTPQGGLKLFVKKFNQIWMSGVQNGSWDDAASKAADLAWLECVINPMSNSLANVCNEGKKKKSKPLPKQQGTTNSVEEHPKPALLDATLYVTLGLVIPKAFVQILVSMCLGKFSESDETRQVEDGGAKLELNEGECKKKAVVVYPSGIVKSLLKTGLVDDKMVRGGVIRGLRRTQDVAMVQLGVAKLIDVGEVELIETIHWVVNKHQNTSDASSLEYLLAKIVAQSLDPVLLRKAIKNVLNTEDTISILKTLLVWIDWWTEFGESSIGMTIEKSMEEGGNNKMKNTISSSSSSSKLKRNEMPNLGKVYEFVEIVLDGKLVELIKSNNNDNHGQVCQVLKSIQCRLKIKIQEDLVLQCLNGSLNQFNNLVRFQKSRSVSTRNSKKFNINNNVSSKVEKKKNKNKKVTSAVKMSNLASSNLQHFLDYSVEKFSL